MGLKERVRAQVGHWGVALVDDAGGCHVRGKTCVGRGNKRDELKMCKSGAKLEMKFVGCF